MPSPPHANSQPATLAGYPHPVAFSIQIDRNAAVQALGVVMVCLMGLTILPWPVVAAWTVVGIAVAVAEHRLLRLVADGGRFAPAAGAIAPIVRVLATTIYAVAAFALLVFGGPGERLFAFALMSASMVHVLMRYYRSPQIMAASLVPYVIVLAIVGQGLERRALQHGHLLGALGSVFTIATFGLAFWSARGQLTGAWNELMDAREAAEERERAAEAANLAKSAFLANMSHELRTPLNAVLGMAQALMGEVLTPLQHERVGVIRRSGESLLEVLDDLLDLSKVEAGAFDLEMTEFDLEPLVRGVVAAYRPLAAKKDLTFEFVIADEARGRYLGDPARIRRILYSLCDNAVKFTHEGGVTLRADREPLRLVFRVADSGIGIGRDDLGRLFEGFFQADATLTRRYGGAGVGLAICGQFTSLMGGVIEAASEPGRGSTFTLALPLERAVPAKTQVAAARSAETDGLTELRVLAAEDNAVNQLVLKALLASAGIEPTMVVNGREALSAWEDQDWDLVLMDIQMPEMNGIEATRAIRLREAETGRVRTPIIAVTANAMTHQLGEYAAAGMDAVVAKPVDVGALFNAMEQALARADEAEQDEPAQFRWASSAA
jgi:signal transduction histidine kinase/FixJ family two-component response regulator